MSEQTTKKQSDTENQPAPKNSEAKKQPSSPRAVPPAPQPSNPKRPPSRTRKIALGGVFSALCVVVMLFGGFIPVATLTAPMLAGLCLLPVVVELGPKTTLVVYATVGILSFFLVPDREITLFFLLLFGYYPVLQPRLARLPNKIMRYAAKLALFNFALALVYVILLFLLVSPALLAEFSGSAVWFWVVLLLMANVTFLLYDLLIDKLRILYIHRFRGRFFR